jgi:hypothetical protein
MLSRPSAGWSQFQIGDFTFPFSYLRNTPQECIDAFCFALEKGVPCSIFFDGEGQLCILTCDDYFCYVIYYPDPHSLQASILTFEKDLKELAKEFVSDIEQNYDAWQHWLCYQDELQDYDLSKLKELINMV